LPQLMPEAVCRPGFGGTKYGGKELALRAFFVPGNFSNKKAECTDEEGSQSAETTQLWRVCYEVSKG